MVRSVPRRWRLARVPLAGVCLVVVACGGRGAHSEQAGVGGGRADEASGDGEALELLRAPR